MINRNQFIEASAGTGKTYTIERLVIQRLQEPLEDGSFPHISQIAVMTFTKAAARELSLRIKKTITKLAAETAGEKKRLLQCALADFEKGHISTIHSFCFSHLSDYAKEQKLEFGELITEDLFYSMVRDFFATSIKSDPQSSAQMRVLLEHFRYDFDTLAKEMVLQLSKEEGSFFLQDEEEEIKRLLASVPKDAFGLLEELSLQFTGCRTRDGTLKNELVHAFTAYVQGNLKQLILHPLYASEVFSTPKKGACVNREFLESLFAFEPLLKRLASPEAIMEKLARCCRDFVRLQMKKKQLYSYDELLLQMEQTLSVESFRSFIRKRFRYVIVDEFQDTDPVQWSILQKAFLDTGCHLVLVGDPKQAIYSFRKADVYSFLQAKETLSCSATQALTTNYRATPSMLQAINTLFCGPHSKELFYLPRLKKSLDVPFCVSSKQEEVFSKAVHFFILEAHIGRKRSWPTEEVEEELLFPFIVEKIRELKGAFRRYAILVKDRFQADRVSLYLKKESIPTTFWRRPSVIGSPAHLLLERFFDLLREPKDLSKLIRFLSHEPFLYDEKKLVFDSFHSYVPFMEQIAALKKQEHSFPRLFDAFLHSFWDGISLCELIAGQEDGKQMLRDLESLFDCIVQEFEGLSLEELVVALRQIPDPDLYPARWDNREDGVVVITMHSSKGLEFDVVFAVMCATRTQACDDEEYESEKIRQLYVACTRAKSALFLPVLVDLDQKIPPKGTLSPLERYFTCLQTALARISHTISREVGQDVAIDLRAQPREHYQVDKARGCARKDRVTDCSNSPKVCEKCGLTGASLEEALQFLARESQGTISCTKVAVNFSKVQSEEPNTTLIQTEAFVPAAIQASALRCRSFTSQNTKIKKERGSSFADPFSGILIHESLQKRIEGGVPCADSLIELAIKTPLKDFCLADIDPKRALCEVEFIFESEGVYTRGCIDLVFEYKEEVFLLDWKTNYLGDDKECYEEESLCQAITSYGYDEQARLYTQAALRNIYQKKPFGGFFFVFVRGLALGASSVLYLSPKSILT
jgi:exodeoxyribonuclease V beta subunit